MSDFTAILTHWASRRAESFALATVVRTTGSTYRQAGARMLIASDGATTGMVSGGCLEREIADRALRVLRQGTPALHPFDTRRLLGCNGSLDILIEAVFPGPSQADLFATAEATLARRNSLVASTLFETSDPLHTPLGSYPLLTEDGARFPTPGLPASACEDGGLALLDERPHQHRYPLNGGSAEVLLHSVVPPLRLYIVGAGPDVTPLASFAIQLGWEAVILVHPSQERPLAPRSCRIIVATADELPAFMIPDSRSAAVIMTHNYGRDLAWLAVLLPLQLRYIGLMGPASRGKGLLNDLADLGALADPSVLSALHNPVGLDIGADGPQEIALAITGEIKAVFSSRTGGFLRQRCGAIHDDPARSRTAA